METDQQPTQKRPVDLLAEQIVDDIDWLAREAEEQSRPIEIEPYRQRLFALFAKAHNARFTAEESDPNLSADTLTRKLGARWGLDDAAKESAAAHQRLDDEQISRMRLLWSVLRLWMEWTYAWDRYGEFHDD